MSYIEESLGNGETVMYRAKLPKAWIWWRIFLGVILLPVFGLGLLVFIPLWIRVKSTEMGVTNQRVIYKRGLFRRNIDEISLRKVESVHSSQSIVARILGYGSVRVHGTGESNITIAPVHAPMAFRKAVLEAIEMRASSRLD